ncbi:hypothetical protein [Escherichia phage phiA2-1]|nr:hypothetical protein [Escherichia phage phiA2-1]
MQKVTLGEVIREMVRKAMESESGEFKVPVSQIFKMIRGRSYPEMEYDTETDEILNLADRSLPELKNSYIYNTVSRMTDLRDANKRARYKFIWIDDEGEQTNARQFDGDGADKYLVIYIENGAHWTGNREKKKQEAQKEATTIERFKARILKLMPSVTEFEGDEISGAIKAIKMYQEMIKETK